MNVIKMFVLALTGAFLLLYPLASLYTVIVVLGIAMICYGVVSCVGFFVERSRKEQKEKKKRTVISLLIGILVLACGIFVVVKPNTVADYFPTLVGLLVLVAGILSCAEAIGRRKESAEWKYMLAVSLATLVLGAIILFRRFDQETTVRILGTGMLYLGAAGAAESKDETEETKP